ncbi:MAG: hypothetical protein GY874_22525 [Desulfobacteraceae bacterium]|nr:hypothetical protein [Desulfobacteraceae bacterium]
MNQQTAKDIHLFPAPESSGKITSTQIGRITAVNSKGIVFVDYPGNQKGPLAARLGVSVMERLQRMPESSESSPLPVILAFEDGMPEKPIIIDIIVEQVEPLESSTEMIFDLKPDDTVSVDGKAISFNAEEQIVLKCGKASITLTKAGKVIIRGSYLFNRSSGLNRIKGGSVQIN